MSVSSSRSSSPSRMSTRDDEALSLSLTFLALSAPASASNAPFAPSAVSSSSDQSTEASICTRSAEEGKDRPRSRRTKSIRQGLSGLPTPPSPFGTRLEPEIGSSKSHSHDLTHDYIPPHPSSPSKDIDDIDPSYPAARPDARSSVSAWEVTKDLALSYGRSAMAAVSRHKLFAAYAATCGLCMVAICRPRWVFVPISFLYSRLSDPWSSYRSVLHSAVMSFHGIYHPML